MSPYYQQDGITIYHGDCREVLATVEPQVGDVVLTDPPYGIPVNTNYAMGLRGTQRSNSRDKNFPPVVGNDGPFDPGHLFRFPRQILWGANHYAHRLPHNGRWLVWDKRAQRVPPRTQADCEFAWSSEYGAARICYHLWDGFLKDSEQGMEREHPTQKPLAVMHWCFGFVPNARRIIDPYLGSGTTLRAAKDAGLVAIGIEIEERYCEIAAKRLSQGVLDFGGAA